YRNPDAGNVSVKWNNVRVIQKITPKEEKIYYRLHFYYTGSKQTAFVLETYSYQEFRDLNILLNYGDIDQSEADYNYFRQNFAYVLRNETIAERLKFIYENIPESILANFSAVLDSSIIFNHLEILSADDDSNIFRDSSSAIIQIFKSFVNPIPILNYYRENPAKLNRIYYNLDKSSMYNGKMQSNRMILAHIMWVLSIFAHNTKQKKTAKTFTIGKGYIVSSNTFEVGIFQQDGDNYRDTFFLQQQKVEQQNVKVIPKEGDPGAKEAIVTDVDEGAQYRPLDMVYIRDINGEKEAGYFVPAILLKAMADEKQWEVILQNIHITADLIAVVIGILTLPAGNPYLLLLAIVDVTLAGADLTFQAFREEIIKHEGGQAFLDAWDEIYAAGAALTVGTLLIGALYKVGLKLLTLPEIVKNVNLQNTIKTYMIGVLLEFNISNFQGNTVKILTQNSEIVTATSGTLNEFKVNRLFERECFIVSGTVTRSSKTAEEFAMVYKGEIIAQGNKTEFYQQIKEIGKDIYSDQRLTDKLEDMVEIPKFVSIYASKLKTEPNEAFFWSGRTNGIGGQEIALEIAISKNGTTLEGLIDKHKIPMLEWDSSNAKSVKQWEGVSEKYAQQVSGDVRAVIGESLRKGNVWETKELPALKDNVNVKRIITIDPVSKKELVIFKR
uniref:hypothetical protein n=1 Tax=uncultured Chryseobacterium sp. TaxID=259322 RepID=UPI0026107563